MDTYNALWLRDRRSKKFKQIGREYKNDIKLCFIFNQHDTVSRYR